MLYQRGLKLLLVFLIFTGLALPTLANEDFRCKVCRKKVQRGYKLGGNFYCLKDIDSARPKCTHCLRSIRGSYRVVSHKEKAVCQDCSQRFPGCFLCKLPSESRRGGTLLGDGRHLCREHNRNGIQSQSEAQRVFRAAVADLKSTFGKTLMLRQPVKEVRLVSLTELSEHSGSHTDSPALSGGHVLGLTNLVFVTQSGKTWTEPASILLLSHVPEERLRTVCIHEYTHAWQAERHRNYQATTPIMREGFAEWVAFKVNEHLGRQEQVKLMLNPKGGVYYRGLKKFIEYEKKNGINATVKYALRAKTI